VFDVQGWMFDVRLQFGNANIEHPTSNIQHRTEEGGASSRHLRRIRGAAGDAPEDAGFFEGLGLLAVHGEDAEVDDVEGGLGVVEAGGDGAFEAAGLELGCGAVFLTAVDGEGLDDPGVGVDAVDAEADGGEDLADGRGHVAERGDEELAGEAETVTIAGAGEVEAAVAAVDGEDGGGLGDGVGVFGEEELRGGLAGGLEVVAPGEGPAGVEVGEAVPEGLVGRDLPEDVAGAVDGAAAADVVGVLGAEEAAVGGEGEGEGVAEAPGDELGALPGQGERGGGGA